MSYTPEQMQRMKAAAGNLDCEPEPPTEEEPIPSDLEGNLFSQRSSSTPFSLKAAIRQRVQAIHHLRQARHMMQVLYGPRNQGTCYISIEPER